MVDRKYIPIPTTAANTKTDPNTQATMTAALMDGGIVGGGNIGDGGGGGEESVVSEHKSSHSDACDTMKVHSKRIVRNM
jgi:hypothetical protein